MADEDMQDQSLPSALMPRQGWSKSSRNPEAVHATVDLDKVGSSGYMDPSYTPAQGPHNGDAADLDQSRFTTKEQGHSLGRISPHHTGVQGSELASPTQGLDPDVPPADGRPAWDGRFHLDRKAWEAEPRAALLRTPSTGAAGDTMGGNTSLCATSPTLSPKAVAAGSRLEAERESGSLQHNQDSAAAAGGLSTPLSEVHGGGRSTILPGLIHSTAPASLRPSPYGPTVSNSGAHPQTSQDGAMPRLSHTNLDQSYVGRAYTPEMLEPQRSRTSGAGGSISGVGTTADSHAGQTPSGAGTGGDGHSPAADEGGMDGHGTHLPALDRAYLHKPAAKPAGAAKEGKAVRRRAAWPEREAFEPPAARYMPKGTLRLPAPLARSMAHVQARYMASTSPPLSHRSAGANVTRDASPGRSNAGGATWRPSGVQPIAGIEALPSPQRSAYHAKRTSGDGLKESQEEADKRRAVPRQPPDASQYPLVGQGWFLPPEKFPVNPAYADARPRYMEPRPPRHDPDEEHDQGHTTMPNINMKPWLTPGKHLTVDLSVLPPAPHNAHPEASTTPKPPAQAEGAGSCSAGDGTLKHTARSGGLNSTAARYRPDYRGARPARGGRGKGGRGKNGRPRRVRGSDSSDSSAEGAEEGEVVLAVIRGVRLMSITRRDDLANEAKLEAEEDEQFEQEDAAVARESAAGETAPEESEPAACAPAEPAPSDSVARHAASEEEGAAQHSGFGSDDKADGRGASSSVASRRKASASSDSSSDAEADETSAPARNGASSGATPSDALAAKESFVRGATADGHAGPLQTEQVETQLHDRPQEAEAEASPPAQASPSEEAPHDMEREEQEDADGEQEEQEEAGEEELEAQADVQAEEEPGSDEEDLGGYGFAAGANEEADEAVQAGAEGAEGAADAEDDE